MGNPKGCDGCEHVKSCLEAGPKLPRSSSTAQRAYRILLCGVTSIVLENTTGKAKLAAFYSAKDAGYRPEWKELSAKRAPEYDGAYIATGVLAKKGICYNPEYLKCAAGKPLPLPE